MKVPIVTLSTGELQGTFRKNIENGLFYSFQGIPYAKPPLGCLKFKAPQPPEPWSGILDATKEGPPCFARHMFFRKIIGSEDCLTLNVYTSDLSEGNNPLKPVMFWIHGGNFTSGSGNSDVYGPEYLLTEGIVLVTINYRVGVLGFLCLEDPDLDIPGNAGLKDIVMALKWVQTNIKNFSGDPNNVTIFGQSAGAAAVHYLILSPMAKGLFHKAILQSGCALNYWAKGKQCAVDIARILGLETKDEKKILAHFQDLPVEQLIRASHKLPNDHFANSIKYFGPVIEKPSKNAFIYEHPVDVIKSGNYNQVPIIIGFTSREGILIQLKRKPDYFKSVSMFQLAVPYFLNLQYGSDISKMVGKQIKEFYYGNTEPSIDNKEPFYLLETDSLIVRDLLRAAKYHTEISSMPLFLCRISIETRLNLCKRFYGFPEPGVCHGDDVGYLFDNFLTHNIKLDEHEYVAVKRFVKLWTNFAKYGDPKEQHPLIDIKWEPATKNSLHFLDIGKKLTCGVNPEAKRVEFWNNIFKVNLTCKL